MGFFKDLKEDFSQAMDELIPEEDTLDEDFPDKITDIEIAKEEADLPVENTAQADDSLEDEVMAAIKELGMQIEEAGIISPEVTAVPLPSVEELQEAEPESILPPEEEADDTFSILEEIVPELEEDRKPEDIESDNENYVEEKIMTNPEDIYTGTENDLDEELLAKLLSEDGTIEEAAADAVEEPEAALPEEETPVVAAVEEETRAEAENSVTVITKGTVIDGSITSDGSLEVMGTITGDVECLGKLSIVGKVSGNAKASEIYVNTSRLEGGLDSKGSVKVGVGTVIVGDIKGTSAVIAGAVKGKVDVDGPVVVDSTAIVKGNIQAKSVQINNGAVIDGYCSLAYSAVDIDNFFDGEGNN